MRIAVFGAAGRTGREVCRHLQGLGHEPLAVTRRKGADVIGTPELLDATDSVAVAALAQTCDAVINAMASGKGNPAGSRLVAALRGRDGLRYVTVAGAAVDAPGDAKGAPDKIVSWISRKIAGEVVTDRQAELDALLADGHGLRWTMMRPPRLTEKEAKTSYRLAFDKPASTQIARADLGRAVVDALSDPELEGRAPFVSW
ncbi:MAG: NAD(P)-dependent oxidoreductase [Paracoccaceae bacterium]